MRYVRACLDLKTLEKIFCKKSLIPEILAEIPIFTWHFREVFKTSLVKTIEFPVLDRPGLISFSSSILILFLGVGLK